MGKFKVIVAERAKKHLLAIEKSGIGNPEKLKYDLTGLWSRQINRKDRLIYQIENDIVTVTIISALGHYSDK